MGRLFFDFHQLHGPPRPRRPHAGRDEGLGHVHDPRGRSWRRRRPPPPPAAGRPPRGGRDRGSGGGVHEVPPFGLPVDPQRLLPPPQLARRHERRLVVRRRPPRPGPAPPPARPRGIRRPRPPPLQGGQVAPHAGDAAPFAVSFAVFVPVIFLSVLPRLLRLEPLHPPVHTQRVLPHRPRALPAVPPYHARVSPVGHDGRRRAEGRVRVRDAAGPDRRGTPAGERAVGGAGGQ
mmetsp:Transcript_15762/g.35342  ORF Transcript_15762/g.35342 Transcript_15762/m.35342 type:complete len:233 (+) Transcript_15762:845-1543(+)